MVYTTEQILSLYTDIQKNDNGTINNSLFVNVPPAFISETAINPVYKESVHLNQHVIAPTTKKSYAKTPKKNFNRVAHLSQAPNSLEPAEPTKMPVQHPHNPWNQPMRPMPNSQYTAHDHYYHQQFAVPSFDYQNFNFNTDHHASHLNSSQFVPLQPFSNPFTADFSPFTVMPLEPLPQHSSPLESMQSFSHIGSSPSSVIEFVEKLSVSPMKEPTPAAIIQPISFSENVARSPPAPLPQVAKPIEHVPSPAPVKPVITPKHAEPKPEVAKVATPAAPIATQKSSIPFSLLIGDQKPLTPKAPVATVVKQEATPTPVDDGWTVVRRKAKKAEPAKAPQPATIQNKIVNDVLVPPGLVKGGGNQIPTPHFRAWITATLNSISTNKPSPDAVNYLVALKESELEPTILECFNNNPTTASNWVKEFLARKRGGLVKKHQVDVKYNYA